MKKPGTKGKKHNKIAHKPAKPPTTVANPARNRCPSGTYKTRPANSPNRPGVKMPKVKPEATARYPRHQPSAPAGRNNQRHLATSKPKFTGIKSTAQMAYHRPSAGKAAQPACHDDHPPSAESRTYTCQHNNKPTAHFKSLKKPARYVSLRFTAQRLKIDC